MRSSCSYNGSVSPTQKKNRSYFDYTFFLPICTIYDCPCGSFFFRRISCPNAVFAHLQMVQLKKCRNSSFFSCAFDIIQDDIAKFTNHLFTKLHTINWNQSQCGLQHLNGERVRMRFVIIRFIFNTKREKRYLFIYLNFEWQTSRTIIIIIIIIFWVAKWSGLSTYSSILECRSRLASRMTITVKTVDPLDGMSKKKILFKLK